MSFMDGSPRDNIGHIDWSEYTPMFFSRLLAHFKLPIKWSQTKANMDYSMPSLWIVSTMNDRNSKDLSVMSQLSKMLKVIQ